MDIWWKILQAIEESECSEKKKTPTTTQSNFSVIVFKQYNYLLEPIGEVEWKSKALEEVAVYETLI